MRGLNKAGLMAAITVATGFFASSASAQFQGPSTSSTPYILPAKPFVETYSIFTTGPANGTGSIDTVSGYQMSGIPDGLGAFDDGNNSTFTVLMNHELGATSGVVRAHGSKGAFVSKWTINKNTFALSSGADLIQTPFLWNGTGYSNASAGVTVTNTLNASLNGTAAFNRFCSADLPEVSAFSFGGLGTTNRIFMNGEESGQEGRAFAHVVNGPDAGKSYELPRLGRFSWENSVASPFAQNKTVVFGTADTSAGTGLFMYVGTKTNTGTEVDKAGLTNGLLYGLRVDGGAPRVEDRNTEFGIGTGSKSFSFVAAGTGGNVTNLTGASVETGLLAGGVAGTATSTFLRPEDIAWDTKTNNTLYFCTTDQYDQVKDGVGPTVGRSRIWKMVLSDIANPQLGGQISVLHDGSGPGQMFDNLTVDKDGNIILEEDVGNNAHNGKVWKFNTTDKSFTPLTAHDRSRFGDIGLAASSPFSLDEENSGVIDITDLMAGSTLNTGLPGERWYLVTDQAHYTGGGITAAMVEGGQLQAIHVVPEPTTLGLLGLGSIGLLGMRRRRA